MDPLDYLLIRCGINPNRDWHGAPVNMWAMCAVGLGLAATGLFAAIAL